jgi:hypothetical protein
VRQLGVAGSQAGSQPWEHTQRREMAAVLISETRRRHTAASFNRSQLVEAPMG